MAPAIACTLLLRAVRGSAHLSRCWRVSSAACCGRQRYTMLPTCRMPLVCVRSPFRVAVCLNAGARLLSFLCISLFLPPYLSPLLLSYYIYIPSCCFVVSSRGIWRRVTAAGVMGQRCGVAAAYGKTLRGAAGVGVAKGEGSTLYCLLSSYLVVTLCLYASTLLCALIWCFHRYSCRSSSNHHHTHDGAA